MALFGLLLFACLVPLVAAGTFIKQYLPLIIMLTGICMCVYSAFKYSKDTALI